MTDNRINQTTVSNKQEDARLAPIEEPVFWTPGKTATLIATLAVGILSALGPIFTAGIFTPATIIGAVLAGISGALAAFFGIKSGGSPK